MIATRRELLALLACGSLLRSALAQTRSPVKIYRDYSRCLPDFIRDVAERAYRTRNAELAKLTTAGAVRARQQWVAETFWKMVGGRPESTPLNARITGSFERPGYRVEKVVYESQPNFHVAANLYIPARGNPPFPGVLFQMGHTANGKAGDLTSGAARDSRVSATWSWHSIPCGKASAPIIRFPEARAAAWGPTRSTPIRAAKCC